MEKVSRQLVVNADDFGYSRDVNRGIIEAHTKGILTATTLMGNGSAFDDAVALAKSHPALDIGCHLVLVEGPSLATGQPLPRSVRELTMAVLFRRLNPYLELRPQVERIVNQGLRPTHLDTHKHTHLLPAVLDAVAKLSEEFDIRWVRRPFDFPLSATGTPLPLRATSTAFSMMRLQFHAKLARHGCRTTDHFAGFQLTGRFRTGQLTQLIRALPPGSTEFMCHPGFCTSELRGMSTRLTEQREMELEALIDPAIRDVLIAERVQLVTYRDLNL
ncbi:MAG TPA: ChbG/HpnK family deacetylase [Bryobacteraceae bacterium]|nr:ChbG/HpnK family deacetylase [Bryobacteraceae bacterium]